MFPLRQKARQLSDRLADVVDAALAGAEPRAGEPEHPHRRPLRLEHERRPGRVPAASQECLCAPRPRRPAPRSRTSDRG